MFGFVFVFVFWGEGGFLALVLFVLFFFFFWGGGLGGPIGSLRVKSVYIFDLTVSSKALDPSRSTSFFLSLSSRLTGKTDFQSSDTSAL